MEISKELQEQQTKVQELFQEAESAQYKFISMAEAEGMSEREIRRRWLYVVEWGTKERNAELWKANLLYSLGDEDIPEIIESMDKLEEELMTYAEPEDMFEDSEALMVECDRRFKDSLAAYASLCNERGMSPRDITHAVAKALGRDLPDDDDPFEDDILE